MLVIKKNRKKLFNMQCHVFFFIPNLRGGGGAVLCRHNIDSSFGQRVNNTETYTHTNHLPALRGLIE
jgi:hypothetical protein